MNAYDFGITAARDWERGACMWVDNDEWCGTALLVADSTTSANPPDTYRYGARYGLADKGGSIYRTESLWVCDQHRGDFLKLHSGRIKTEVYQFDTQGNLTQVLGFAEQEYEVGFQLTVNAGVQNEHSLKLVIKQQLSKLLSDYPDIQGWSHVDVAEVME